jgi:hypothetical protein
MTTDDEIRAAAERVMKATGKALAFPERLDPKARAFLGEAYDVARVYLNPWRPIETADKDADRVLVYADHWRFASWGRTASGNQKGWFDKESGFMIFPTHWTSLPGPPPE